MERLLVSRREPLVTLKPFRYLGRNYVAGMIIDRRRTPMTTRRMQGLIQGKMVKLAKDMTEKQLAKYGFSYNKGSVRQKLFVKDPDKVVQKSLLNGRFRDHYPKEPEKPRYEVIEQNDEFWVWEGQDCLNEEGLTKEEADQFLAELKGE